MHLCRVQSLVLTLLLVAPNMGQQEKQQPKVYLTASCDGPIGGTVASALRERIRSSSGYGLADTPATPSNALGPEILLMCTDLQDDPASAVAYVISFRVGRTRDIGKGGVDIVGRAKIDQEAQSLFSKMDNWWTEFSANNDHFKNPH
jgi:hypothetical protein